MTNLKSPLPNATCDFLQDVVTGGGINYSFTDYYENIVVDFDYLCSRLDSDTMTELTDKIKDLVYDALDSLKDSEGEENED